MNPKIGQTWTGTTKYVENQLIDIHDVVIIHNEGNIIKYKRLDNGKESMDIVFSFIENFKLNHK